LIKIRRRELKVGQKYVQKKIKRNLHTLWKKSFLLIRSRTSYMFENILVTLTISFKKVLFFIKLHGA